MVSQYPTEKAAADAIRLAVAAGRAEAGYSQLRFGGMHGSYYTAHVRKGCGGWCL
jgi:hypothetical protein